MLSDRNSICRISKVMYGGGALALCLGAAVLLSACGKKDETFTEAAESEVSSEDITQELQKLTVTNPDVFGWLYIPGTGINYPITQNIEGDDTYYLTHEPNGITESDKGGIYIESANLMDMCDFNTVIHGKTTSDGDMFSELWNFADADYFKEHDQFFIFLPDNTLTYEIWTAYEADNDNLLSSYDLTERDGCQAYLDDMKHNWTTRTNFREGWEQGVDPDNFIVSLSTVDDKHPDKQWIVVGCLVGDVAGTIDRDMDGDLDPADEEYYEISDGESIND